jgi:hypothetical protein
VGGRPDVRSKIPRGGDSCGRFWTSFATTSQATTISFASAGALSCGTNATCTLVVANSLEFSSTLAGGPALRVTYNPGGDTQIAPPPASANFGSVALSCAGCSVANNANWDLSGTSGVVNINQMLPLAGSNALSGNFTSASLGWRGLEGINGAQAGSALLTWVTAMTTIAAGGGEALLYDVFSPAVLLQLGTNSIQGLVTTVPEASTLTLLALGLLGVGHSRRRNEARDTRSS